MNGPYLKLLDHLYWVPNEIEYKKLLRNEYNAKYPALVRQSNKSQTDQLFIMTVGPSFLPYPMVLEVTSWRYHPETLTAPATLSLDILVHDPVTYASELSTAANTLQACVRTIPSAQVRCMGGMVG